MAGVLPRGCGPDHRPPGAAALLSDEDSLADALARVATETEIDEVILVPASVDPASASVAAALVAG